MLHANPIPICHEYLASNVEIYHQTNPWMLDQLDAKISQSVATQTPMWVVGFLHVDRLGSIAPWLFLVMWHDNITPWPCPTTRIEVLKGWWVLLYCFFHFRPCLLAHVLAMRSEKDLVFMVGTLSHEALSDLVEEEKGSSRSRPQLWCLVSRPFMR